MDVERKLKYSNSFKGEVVKAPIDLNLDIQTLDMICNYIVTDNSTIRRRQLINLQKFIFLINPSIYENDFEKSKRISFIKKGIEARLMFNLTNPVFIVKHISGGIIDDSIVNLDTFKGLSSPEINWLDNMVSEALKFSDLHNFTGRLIDICHRVDSTDYGSKSSIVKEFETTINEVQNIFRKNKNDEQTETMFTLREGDFENCIYEFHSQLISPKRRLITGMHGFNELLGGGFESGRVYVLLALPGEGKTTTMLNLLVQMKKYNKGIKLKDPTKIPCIVLLTMENTTRENTDTVFSISTSTDAGMENYSPDDIINLMRIDGGLYINQDSPINIAIKFVPNKSVDTNYLYTLTEFLEDDGYEVIAVLQDYIGRIRSADNSSDIRLEYGNVVNEFKTFASLKDIPIISASQLNRDASKSVDEGKKANKSDLVRLLGRNNISESMLILNNADGVFILAPEYTVTGEKYLGLQLVKHRFKVKTNNTCIYLPYKNINSIGLIDDYESPIPIYKITLKPENPDFSNNLMCPRQSAYHTNKITVLDQTLKDDGEHNIFKSSASVISSNSNALINTNMNNTLIDPFEFF